MEWISFKKKQPKVGEYIAEVRRKYPAFVWIGHWRGLQDMDETDIPDYWMLLPEPPKS